MCNNTLNTTTTAAEKRDPRHRVRRARSACTHPHKEGEEHAEQFVSHVVRCDVEVLLELIASHVSDQKVAAHVVLHITQELICAQHRAPNAPRLQQVAAKCHPYAQHNTRAQRLHTFEGASK